MTEFATTHPEQFGLAQVHWPSFREALCGCVVDLGAGEGSTLDLKSRVAPSIFRPRLLVEVDVVQEAREGTAHRVCGDLDSGRLPLASRSFDAVICNHVLEHLEQPDLLLGEIARVVRPGGLLVTAVPNGAAMSDVLFRAWYGATHRGESRFRGHVQRFTRASFLDMLRVGGFDTLSVSDMGEAYSWLRKHPWLQKPLRALTTRLRRLDNDRFIYGWHVIARRRG